MIESRWYPITSSCRKPVISSAALFQKRSTPSSSHSATISCSSSASMFKPVPSRRRGPSAALVLHRYHDLHRPLAVCIDVLICLLEIREREMVGDKGPEFHLSRADQL